MKHLKKYKNLELISNELRNAISKSSDLSQLNQIVLNVKNNNLHMSDNLNTIQSSNLQSFFKNNEEEILNCYYNDLLKSTNNEWIIKFVIYSDLAILYYVDTGSEYPVSFEEKRDIKNLKMYKNLEKIESILKSKNFTETEENSEGLEEFEKIDFKIKPKIGEYYYLAYEKKVKSILELNNDFKLIHNIANNIEIASSDKLININDKTGIFND